MMFIDELLLILIRRRLAKASTDALRKSLLTAIGEDIARQAATDVRVSEKVELAAAERQLKAIGEYELLDTDAAPQQ